MTTGSKCKLDPDLLNAFAMNEMAKVPLSACSLLSPQEDENKHDNCDHIIATMKYDRT